jgi:metal-responsive CopG/Arc/MetJ family transcriptional regulator
MPRATIYLPDEVAELIDGVVAETGASRSSVVQMLILTFFDENVLRSGTVRSVFQKFKNRARNAAEAEK